MKRVCPDCQGRGAGCETCKGHGEWTCPICGFREGQTCEQYGVPVPCAPVAAATSEERP